MSSDLVSAHPLRGPSNEPRAAMSFSLGIWDWGIGGGVPIRVLWRGWSGVTDTLRLCVLFGEAAVWLT